MNSQRQQDFCRALHEAVSARYCALPLSRISEKACRQQLLDAEGAVFPALTGLLSNRMKRSAQALRRGPSAAHAPPWAAGDVVLLPANENSAAPMWALYDGLKARAQSCALLVTRAATRWNCWSSQVAPRRPWIQPPLTPGASPQARQASAQFQKELNAFACQYLSDNPSALNLNTRCARVHDELLQSLGWIEMIRRWIRQSRPSGFVANRPKGILPLCYLLAGHLEGVPNVFISHSIVRSLKAFRPAFYDLSLFDVAIVPSHKCRQIALSLNPDLKVIVSGWPEGSEQAIDCEAMKAGKSLKVGYAAGYDYEQLRRVTHAAMAAEVDLVVKGRPPGGDQDSLDKAVSMPGNIRVKALAHEQQDLPAFLSEIDLLICGRSNVGFLAAAKGIPVVIYCSDEERRKACAGDDGLRVSDIALSQADQFDDLVEHLKQVKQLDSNSITDLCSRQKNHYRRHFPEPSSARVTHELMGLIS